MDGRNIYFGCQFYTRAHTKVYIFIYIHSVAKIFPYECRGTGTRGVGFLRIFSFITANLLCIIINLLNKMECYCCEGNTF